MILRGFIHRAMGWLTAMLAVLFSVLSLYSCSSDSEQQKPQVAVAFQIVLPETTTTRAANTDWSDYDPSDPGNEMENRIDVNDIQVVFLDSENNVTLKVTDLHVTPMSGYNNIYNVTATIDDPSIVGTTMNDVKVMVFVNCENKTTITDATKANAFANIAFQKSLVGADKWNNYIPMWGVSTTASLTFTPGKQVDIGEIWLLRAKAKVTVEFDQTVTGAGYTLKNGSLKLESKVQDDFYCLPSEYATAANTKSMTYFQSFHPYTVGETSTNHEFTDNTLYTPEYDNTSTGATKAIISFSLEKGGATTNHKLQFKNYDSDGAPIDGSDYDIVRNHWYRFVVYTTSSSSGIKIKLNVQPWAKYTHDDIVM